MGREIRRVPADWRHPKDERGRFKPLFDRPFEQEAREWLDAARDWDLGLSDDAEKHKDSHPFYWQWAGNPPNAKYYRPKWASEPTHYQMYENTTEGTPISPVMASHEELAHWLADNNASAMGDQGASYEAWLRVCQGGYAPTMIIKNGILTSGVEGL